jgi:hypothetical protein
MKIYYTVLDLATSKPVYRGTSVTAAANALTPGRVFGKGIVQAAATYDAKVNARAIGIGCSEKRTNW